MRGDVEHDRSFGVKSELFPVLNFGFGGVIDNEVRLEVLFFLFGRTDEHIADKVRLPGDFHDEADCHTGVFVGATEAIDNIEFLARELF